MAAVLSPWWVEIISYFRRDAELADWLTDEVSAELSKIQMEEMMVWKEATLYQGFDITRILKLALANHKAHMAQNLEESVTIKVTVGNEKKEFVYTNKESMVKDLHFLIFIFANRGCSWDKLMDKTNEDVKTILLWIKGKFKLDTDTHAAGKSLPPDMVTIARLTAAFPSITCDIFRKQMAKELVTLSDLHLPQEFTHAVLTPLFCSMISPMHIDLENNVHVVFFLAHVIVDDILHRKKAEKTSLEDIFSYYKAAYSSPATPSHARAGYCARVGVLTPIPHSYVQPLILAIPLCEADIKERRNDDPKLDEVLREVKKLSVV